MAEPTKPRCPATKIFADLSELKESDVVSMEPNKKKKEKKKGILLMGFQRSMRLERATIKKVFERMWLLRKCPKVWSLKK